ncbi:PREDICTED: nascent polypeptide-associated complex subunit alpha, muscle-specific form-like, partial [Wasmannia auropunctata]|uniref:nascent polypeptide-associated complex subunit alpha, muscle-specific form-like n=1 Tax=Wasmannia auropunctata TaxID=64793 RepID=UPI0005F0A5C9
MAEPRVHIIKYPVPPNVYCERCFNNPEARVQGKYSDPPHLAKHLKACHPGDTLGYICSVCGFRGTGAYPLKAVRLHFAKEHDTPGGDAAGPSTRGDSDTGESVVAGARTRSARAAASSTGTVGVSRSRAAKPRQPIVAPTVTPTPGPPSPPATTAESPSYATVTAGITTRRPSTPTTVQARGRTVAKSAASSPRSALLADGQRDRAIEDRPIGRLAAMRRPPRTTAAAVTGSPVLQVRVQRLPDRSSAAASSARAPPHPSPNIPSTAGGSALTSIATRKSGEGAAKRPPARTTSTRRAVGASSGKSSSSSTARPGRVPPHPTPCMSSGGAGTPNVSGGAEGTFSFTRQSAGRNSTPFSTPAVNTRNSRPTDVPVAKSALRESGNAASWIVGGRSLQRTPPRRSSPTRPPSLPLSGTPTGGPFETRTSVSPATSLPATLTTCTVTTT